ELSQAPVKQAARDGLTPFGLLAAAAGGSDELGRLADILGVECEAAQKRAGDLFREYFYAFKGRPRLHWGKMREILELDDALDEFAEANPEPDNTFTMAFIAPDDYGKLKLRDPDWYADVLAIASTGNVLLLKLWFEAQGIQPIIPEEAWHRSAAYLKRRKNGGR